MTSSSKKISLKFVFTIVKSTQNLSTLVAKKSMALSSHFIRFRCHSKKCRFRKPLRSCVFTTELQNLDFFGHFWFPQRFYSHTTKLDRAEVKTAAEPQFFGNNHAAI